MKYFIIIVIPLIFLMNCLPIYRNKSFNNIGDQNSISDSIHDTLNQNIVLTEALLFKSNLSQIARENEHTHLEILHELRKRAIKRDLKSFYRLLDVGSDMDGCMAEEYGEIMGDLFKNNIEYFIKKSYKHKNAENVYCFVIFSLYYDEVNKKKYPDNYGQITILKKESLLFQKVYNNYLEIGF